MKFTVRIGEKKDAKAILNLITALAIFEKAPDAVEINEEDLLRDGFSENPKFKTFVAQQNEEIIGIALFYERYSTWKGKTIHLEDLIVGQGKRGLGVGKALYTAVLCYASENDYKRVAWEVLNWNKNAIDFYKSTGAEILNDWQVVQMDAESLLKFVALAK